MLRRISCTPCFVFLTTSSFTRHHVWIGSAKAGILWWLVNVNHYFVACCDLHYFEIMAHHKLTLMMFATRQLVYVTCFKSVDIMLCQECKCIFKLAFIVCNVSTSLMV